MAISALTEAELARLGQVARLRARGLDLDWQDLLHEAIERTLDGSRRWPPAIPFSLFLREVIRSLASDSWRVQKRRAAVGCHVPDEALAKVAAEGESPEEAAIGRDLLAAVERLFDGDAVALGLLGGLYEGFSPTEIQGQLGIDMTTYDSTRRRIRRRIAAKPEIFQ